MSTETDTTLTGRGAAELDLAPEDLHAIVDEALASIQPGSRVLAIIPDATRDDPTAVLFPRAAKALAARRVARFDALVAQGTHPPMSDRDKRTKIGTGAATGFSFDGEIFDHRWDRPEELVTIGQLSSELVAETTNGAIDESISLTLNRLLDADVYDDVVIFGATTPHEVAGFSGGAKYLFPGVSGPDLTHATHWLGALVSIERVIGRIETPTRHLIEAAADRVAPRLLSLNSVVTRDGDRLRTHALFCGDVRRAFRAAARVSGAVHVRTTGRTYRRVVARLDDHYDDLWVGGKASYKLGGIIADGGELLIVAPQLDRVSDTHGALIEKYGYAPLEIVRELVATSAELRANLCVAAHLAHVAYAGRRDASGGIVPKYRIVLASALDRPTCERLNLEYRDLASIDWAELESDPDTLVVDRAGRDLYLVGPPSGE